MCKKLKSYLIRKIKKHLTSLKRSYARWICQQYFKLKKAKQVSAPSEVQSPLMTVDEVADYLRISKATIYSKRSRHELPEECIAKVFGKLLFVRKEIDKLIADSMETTLKKF